MATPFMNAAIAEARAALDKASKITDDESEKRDALKLAQREVNSAEQQFINAKRHYDEAVQAIKTAKDKLRVASQSYQDGDYEKARDAENEVRVALDKLKNSGDN